MQDIENNAPGMREQQQRAALIRHRRLAVGLLLLMAGVFISTHLAPEPNFWVLLTRAGAEAAMVGGLADWFAVTALFRHPLGIPIPHTAIIPRNKQRIGQGLARFVEHNFMDPALVAQRVRSLDPATHLGRWLAAPGNAEAVATRMAAAIPYLVRSLEDRQLREFLRGALHEQLQGFKLAPVAGSILQVLTEKGQHQVLFDRALVLARGFLDEHRDRIYEMVEERSRWWIPSAIDRKVAEAILAGVGNLLDELSQQDAEARRRFDLAVSQFIKDLSDSPEHQARVERLKGEVLASPLVQDYLGSVWDELRERLVRDAGADDSRTRAGIANALQSMGRSLNRDSAARDRLNHWIEQFSLQFVVPSRGEIGRFITDVVERWDTHTVTERIELAVGRDLQFIRINGTLVGALVGCAIFLVVHAVF